MILTTNQRASRLMELTVGRADELAVGCEAGQVACNGVVRPRPPAWGEDS
jgi:hypothetical protein